MKSRQKGIATVEFAIIGAIFFGFMFAIIEVSWWLYTINTLTEVSRSGARQASLCVTLTESTGSGTLKSGAQGKIEDAAMLDLIKGATLTVNTYPANNVWPGTVTVTINHTYKTLIPGLHLLLGSKNPIGFPMPEFSTSLPVESDECP